ncbi:bifunctional purine biosynthetic protein ADE1 [Apiospora arundinis]
MVVGKGGREHAMAWRLAHSPSVSRNIVLPGNAGTESTAKTQSAVSIKANDNPKIVSFARENGVNLVVGGIEEQFLGSVSLVVRLGKHHCGSDKDKVTRECERRLREAERAGN